MSYSYSATGTRDGLNVLPMRPVDFIPMRGSLSRRLTTWAAWAADRGADAVLPYVENALSYLPESPRGRWVADTIRARVAGAIDFEGRCEGLDAICVRSEIEADATGRAEIETDAHKIAAALVRTTDASADEAAAAALAVGEGEAWHVLSCADSAALQRQREGRAITAAEQAETDRARGKWRAMEALSASREPEDAEVTYTPLDIRKRLRSVTYDAATEVTPAKWLVKSLFPQTGLGMLFGESSAGKTFLALDLALRVAYGLDFSGRRTKQAGVVIVAAEAGASVLTRLSAAERHLRGELLARQLTANLAARRAPIEVIIEAPNLSKDGSPTPLRASIEDAAGRIRAAGHELGLVVVDTLHASMGGGDENSAADAAFVLTPTRRRNARLPRPPPPSSGEGRGARRSRELCVSRGHGHGGQPPSCGL